MTNPWSTKRRPRRSAKPRPYIVEVTNTWRVTPDGKLRRVIVRELDGSLTERHVPDSHPALVRHLERLHAAVA